MRPSLPLVIIPFLFGGHIDPEVSVCFENQPPAYPLRETHLLIITSAIHRVPEAEEAVVAAAKRWELLGINFIIVLDPTDLWINNEGFWEEFQKDNLAPNSRRVIATVAWDEECVAGFFIPILGLTKMKQIIFRDKSERLVGLVALCPQVLNYSCENNEDCWAFTAQHELGHALGLIHHRGSLMRPAGFVCEAFGFTVHDYHHLYDEVREDRVLHPLLID